MKDWKTLAGLILTALAIVVGLWQFWYSDARGHGLRLEVVSATPLSNVDLPSSGVKVLVDGQEVADANVTTLRLTNDGLRPIMASDFESPLEIGVNQGANIIKVRALTSTPPDLAPVIAFDNARLRIKPMLLNAGDALQLSVMTAGPLKAVFPHARIAGVSFVEVGKAASDNPGVARVIFVSVGMLATWLVGLRALFGDKNETRFYVALSYCLTPVTLFYVFAEAAGAGDLQMLQSTGMQVVAVTVMIGLTLLWGLLALREVFNQP